MMRRILPLVTGSLLLVVSAAAQPPKKATAFLQQGIELRDQNRFPEAMVAFKYAIALNKNYDSAYSEAGKLFAKSGQFDSAIIYFRKALALNPGLVETQIAFGNIYRDARPNYDSAIICYINALSVEGLKNDSLKKLTLYSIAWCYNAKQDYEKAIPFGIKALEVDNTYRPAYGELGHAYRRTKKFAEGIEQFKKNIAISPVDLPYYYSGMMYTELNQKEDALKVLTELEKINPKLAASLKKKIDAMQ